MLRASGWWQVGTNNANDDEEDMGLPIWAGRVPMKMVPGEPVPCPRLDPAYAEVPEYIQPYRRPTQLA